MAEVNFANIDELTASKCFDLYNIYLTVNYFKYIFFLFETYFTGITQ